MESIWISSNKKHLTFKSHIVQSTATSSKIQKVKTEIFAIINICNISVLMYPWHAWSKSTIKYEH